MADPIPMQIHRHFKGEDKKYLVLCVATDTEAPHAQRVIYVPLYGENAGKTLSRPLSMWQEYVSRDLDSGEHYQGPRFWPLPEVPPSLG